MVNCGILNFSVQILMSVLLIMEAVNMNVLTLLALTSVNAEVDSSC